MKYKIAAFLCETPLARIPFINQWIDDQFDRMEYEHMNANLDAIGGVEGLLADIEAHPENHQTMPREMWDEIDELLKDVNLDDEEIKPWQVGSWLRRLSEEALK